MSEKLITRAAAVCVGTYDWEWPDWNSSYYPEDLPRDWRASFYANDVQCVCLPQARWLSASDQQLSDWCDDLLDEFRFYLEIDGPSSGDGSGDAGSIESIESSALRARLDIFGPRLAAILCAGAGQATVLSEALGERSVAILTRDRASIDEAPGQAPIERLWRGTALRESMHVACVEIDAGQPRVWRETLAALTARFGVAESAAIFLRGAGVTPALAREFRLVAELMGLA